MSQYVPNTGPVVVIDSIDHLVEELHRACKPREAWRIGTEYEKLAVRPADGRAVPFSGATGIEAALTLLAERFGWEPLLEEGRVVALRRGAASITLEPGGQIELSGEPWKTVHETAREFRQHIEEVVAVSAELDIAVLSLGMQPVSRPEDIELVPKQRYRIMAPYMRRVGTLGVRMMKQTATVQVNLDFASEANAMTKMRVGMGTVPLVSAMFANSPLSDGNLNGYLTYRGHIWTDTDPQRSGLLRFIFEPGAGFADYVQYALDVPMYFIIRDGWIDMTAYTFRRFLREGYGTERATLADWHAHLTTLFPEVRLKSYIEIRSADAQSPELTLALPALATGVYDDDDCLLAAWDLVKQWSWEERVQAYHDAHRGALAARIGRYRLRELCTELLDIATHGLRRRGHRSARGDDETVYLERLADQVRKGQCPAEIVREKWIGEWNREVTRMVAATTCVPEAAPSPG